MKIDASDMLNSILESLSRIDYIHADEIPNIDLYMDQVTTFMDSQLSSTRRYEQDKILTKTMINNYAKNNLLPPPVKKKYSREHVLMLIFIYYYKGILSINDIQTLLKPLSDRYFHARGEELNLGVIYEEIFGLEKTQLDALKNDILNKFETFVSALQGCAGRRTGILQLFSFIGLLSFDVYLKKLLIEKWWMSWEMRPERVKGKIRNRVK